MSATSASSASRRRARSSTRSRSAAPATRRAVDRRDHRPGLLVRRGGRCGRDAGRHLSRKAREAADEPFLAAYRRARSGTVQGGALWRRLKPSPRRSMRWTPAVAHADDVCRRRSRRALRRRASDRRGSPINDVFPGQIALVSSFGADSRRAPASRRLGRSRGAGHLHRHRQDVRLDAPLSRRDRARLGLMDVRIARARSGGARRRTTPIRRSG